MKMKGFGRWWCVCVEGGGGGESLAHPSLDLPMEIYVNCVLTNARDGAAASLLRTVCSQTFGTYCGASALRATGWASCKKRQVTVN